MQVRGDPQRVPADTGDHTIFIEPAGNPVRHFSRNLDTEHVRAALTGAGGGEVGGVTQTQSSGSFINGQAQQTFINRFDIVGQGPGNNFTTHETAHLTLNANGRVTVFFDNFSVDCR